MDMKVSSLSDWDGSSLVSEIDEDFADTFCTDHAQSKLEITSFRSSSYDIDSMESEQKQCRSINTVIELDDSAVRCSF
jgi:hypothetical protein